MDQSEIHMLVLSAKVRDRIEAARLLKSSFQYLPDKVQAWDDLHKLIKDDQPKVRVSAVKALGEAFCEVPNKNQAWNDFLELAQDKDVSVKEHVAYSMKSAIVCIPKDDLAWQDLLESTQELLLKLTQDIDIGVRRAAAILLGAAVYYIPDKDLACRDLQRLLSVEQHPMVRNGATIGLGLAIPIVPNKEMVSQIIHELSIEREDAVREGAAIAFGLAFEYISDKVQGEEDIYRLLHDKNIRVRWMATDALGLSFLQVSDRARGWRELVERTQDSFLGVKKYAIDALKSSFPYAPDKHQAWKDLLGLTNDKDEFVRRDSAFALKYVVTQIPEMEELWRDLIKLAQHGDPFVRRGATDALGPAFTHVTNKEQASQDLYALSRDKDSIVRAGIASALGSVFSQVSDRDLTWTELNRLIEDENSHVRMYAYHSLGRASVLKAAEATNEDDLREELERAINYFERASKEEPRFNPAHFCYPFYCSYYEIVFQHAADEVVQKYVTDAREAIGRSGSKEDLIRVVNDLAKALDEAQRLKNRPYGEIADNLNVQRLYCEDAARLMDSVEKKAPSTIKLLRRCNVIIEDKIRYIIAEIQDEAKKIFEIASKSSPEYKTLGANLNKAASLLSAVDFARTEICSSRMISQIESCKRLPAAKRGLLCEAAKEANSATNLPDRLEKLDQFLRYFIALIESSTETYRICVAEIVVLTVLQVEYNAVCDKLSNIRSPPEDGPGNEKYSWKLGEIYCKEYNNFYTIAIGMIGRAGTIQSALAAFEATILWNPFYIFLVGVAGGFNGLRKADVVIADVIRGYEYGKIDDGFIPRDDWKYFTDAELLKNAIDLGLNSGWRSHIQIDLPDGCTPKVLHGEFASGDKVVDNPSDPFFARVLREWPEIKAVEMEGIGVGHATDHVKRWHERGSNINGFIMIRGISDLPRPPSEEEKRGTVERDNWKPCAADTAAAFAVSMIADGLPIQPLPRKGA